METKERIVYQSLFGAASDIRFAYENGEKRVVSEHVIDMLKDKVPEEELKYIADYLNSRLNHE